MTTHASRAVAAASILIVDDAAANPELVSAGSGLRAKPPKTGPAWPEGRLP